MNYTRFPVKMQEIVFLPASHSMNCCFSIMIQTSGKRREIKMKKLLALLLAASLLTVTFSACSSGSTASGASAAPQNASSSAAAVVKTATYNCNDGDPGTLDPFQPASSSRSVCLMQVYDRLLEYDADGKLVGDLAKSWSQDGKVVTVNLYDNIYDTAGNHFTAADVVYCIQKEIDGGNTYAKIFTDMQAADDTTVKLTLNSDIVSTFENNVVYLYMVTKAAYEASGSNMSMSPVSTAAYKVQKYESGSTLTLVKNDKYWQSAANCKALIQQQNADTVVYNLMKESSQVIVGLESGTIDAAFCDFTLATRFQTGGEDANKGFEVSDIATWGGNALFFNDSAKSFFHDNVSLKKAILYSIDRQGIIDTVFNGHATNPCCYGQLRYADANPAWANQDYFNYNAATAADYFKQSGYTSGQLTLRLIYPTSSYCDNMANLVQAYLSVLGIKVEINSLDAAIYSQYIVDSSRWDISFIGKGGSGSITRIWNATLNRTNYSKDGSYCAGFINDDTLQTLVETAANQKTNSVAACDAVQKYLIEKAYNMQLYVEDKCVVSNTKKISKCCTNIDARWVPGASTYTWNS